jgi:uncharacterized protein YfaT (DUF1175 family)
VRPSTACLGTSAREGSTPRWRCQTTCDGFVRQAWKPVLRIVSQHAYGACGVLMISGTGCNCLMRSFTGFR